MPRVNVGLLMVAVVTATHIFSPPTRTTLVFGEGTPVATSTQKQSDSLDTGPEGGHWMASKKPSSLSHVG